MTLLSEYLKQDGGYTLNDYQERIKSFAKYPEVGTGSLTARLYDVLGLNGEAGEVAEKFKKIMRDKGSVFSLEDDEEILKEMGDVLWYLAALASEMNYTLEEVALYNVNKLQSRLERNVLGGNGDNR